MESVNLNRQFSFNLSLKKNFSNYYLLDIYLLILILLSLYISPISCSKLKSTFSNPTNQIESKVSSLRPITNKLDVETNFDYYDNINYKNQKDENEISSSSSSSSIKKSLLEGKQSENNWLNQLLIRVVRSNIENNNDNDDKNEENDDDNDDSMIIKEPEMKLINEYFIIRSFNQGNQINENSLDDDQESIYRNLIKKDVDSNNNSSNYLLYAKQTSTTNNVDIDHHNLQQQQHNNNDNNKQQFLVNNNTESSISIGTNNININNNSLKVSDVGGMPKSFKKKTTLYKIVSRILVPILRCINWVYGLVFIIGLIGNLTVIYFIAVKTNHSKSKFERVTDFYICNLAGADLMFISGLPFIIMRNITNEWVLGDLACKMYMSSTSLNQFASSFLLVAMGFDRFMVVCIPIYAHKFRQLKSAIKICGLIWFISIPLMTPIFKYSKLENNTLCTIGWPDSTYISYGIAFTVYSFALGFALPLLLIACFYISILRKLRKRQNSQINTSSARKVKNLEARNRKTEHLVVVIICTYTICWSPYWICQFIISLVDEKDVDPMVYDIFVIATSLSYANSAFNPIIYAFLNENFKRRYVESSFFLVKFFQRFKDNNNNNNHLNINNNNKNNNNSREGATTNANESRTNYNGDDDDYDYSNKGDNKSEINDTCCVTYSNLIQTKDNSSIDMGKAIERLSYDQNSCKIINNSEDFVDNKPNSNLTVVLNDDLRSSKNEQKNCHFIVEDKIVNNNHNNKSLTLTTINN